MDAKSNLAVQGKLRISVNCPSPFVKAGTTHRFECTAFLSLDNQTGADVPAQLVFTIGEFGQELGKRIQEVVIPVGTSDLAPPATFSHQMDLTAGSKAVKIEARITTSAQPPELVVAHWQICHFIVE